MKIGKVPENVLERSVFKQLHTKRPEVLMGAGIGEDCAAVKLAEDEIFILSTDPITGTAKDIGKLAIQITVNDLASSGAEPVGVLLTILLPPEAKESHLKKIMEQMEEACAAANVQIMGGHTEVTPVVNQPVVTVCGVGKVKEGKLVVTSGAKPGMDIVVTKWVGIEGTSIIAKEKEEELKTRFSASFIDKAKDLDVYLSVLSEAAVAIKHGVAAMHDMSEGGVFGALWELGEAGNCGLKVDLRKITMRQETIELTNHLNINPYLIASSGSLLMVTSDGLGLVSDLAEAGIAASIIGKITEDNDRIIVNEDEKRFLEPPRNS